MLSHLDWNLLSIYGNCSIPDDYDPCPNINHEPHIFIAKPPSTTTPSTTTTSTTIPRLTSTKKSLSRIESKLPNHFGMLRSKQKSYTDLTLQDKSVLENKFHIYLSILCGVFIIFIVVMGIICWLCNCLTSAADKKQSKVSLTTPDVQSSRTESLISTQGIEELYYPSSHERSSFRCNIADSFDMQAEFNTENRNDTSENHETEAIAEPFIPESVSTHDYYTVNYHDNVLPAQKTHVPCKLQQNLQPILSTRSIACPQPAYHVTVQVTPSNNQYQLVNSSTNQCQQANPPQNHHRENYHSCFNYGQQPVNVISNYLNATPDESTI